MRVKGRPIIGKMQAHEQDGFIRDYEVVKHEKPEMAGYQWITYMIITSETRIVNMNLSKCFDPIFYISDVSNCMHILQMHIIV